MKIAIVGCGNMGAALAQRLSKKEEVFLFDHHFEKSEKLSKEGYGMACPKLEEALHAAETVILAIKPQNLKQAAPAINKALQKKHVLVSLLAGTPLETLKHHFTVAQIVWMMPNLAVIHGEGVIGLSSTENITEDVKELLTSTFEPLGTVYWLPEEKMNALAALTGSGPAFVFTLVEAMIDAGIAMGFKAHDARKLVLHMLRGSLTLLEKSDKHPGELRWQITSPQGTTIAGLQKFEELALRGGIIDTFLATYERGRFLS